MSVRCNWWLRVAFALVVCLSVVRGAPIWEELFGLPPPEPAYDHQQPYGGYGGYGGNRQPTSYRAPRARPGGKEKYKATCWVLSADNYAFPGQSPYPSAPLCPY